MFNTSKILICYFTLFKILQANELMECITQRQSGFHFLGKDYFQSQEIEKILLKIKRRQVSQHLIKI